MKAQNQGIRLKDYPYTYARVSAMRALLLKKAEYDKLLKMRENEIAKYLQDFEYKTQITKYASTLTGSPLVERAIRENLTATLSKLKRISQSGLKSIITEYLKKEDVWNIKTIIRGKFTKTQNDKIRELLVPVGDLDSEDLNKLLALDDIERILDLAGLTKYAEIKFAIKNYKEKKQLEVLEAAIDNVFYKNLVLFINQIPKDARMIRDLLAGEVDATNIRLILKFKREKAGDEVIRNLLFVSRASKISRAKWEKIINAKNFEAIAKEFENTPYESIMKKGIEELTKKNTLSEVDLSLQRFLLSRARTKTHQNPLSIDVILAYMLAKEIEIRNIHLIVKSKQLGLNEAFMQKELII